MASGPLHRAGQRDGAAPDDSAARTIDGNTAFRLLDGGRRRAVVRHLASASRPVRVGTLADAVATSGADAALSASVRLSSRRRSSGARCSAG